VALEQDPLRILRAVRLAATYDLKISDFIKNQIQEDYMIDLFNQKVAKARVSYELDKML
jgi:tRNA nucleotidyltransferase/poly(A) polymerase